MGISYQVDDISCTKIKESYIQYILIMWLYTSAKFVIIVINLYIIIIDFYI